MHLPSSMMHIVNQGLDESFDKTSILGDLVAAGLESTAEKWVASLSREYQVVYVEQCIAQVCGRQGHTSVVFSMKKLRAQGSMQQGYMGALFLCWMQWYNSDQQAFRQTAFRTLLLPPLLLPSAGASESCGQGCAPVRAA